MEITKEEAEIIKALRYIKKQGFYIADNNKISLANITSYISEVYAYDLARISNIAYAFNNLPHKSENFFVHRALIDEAIVSGTADNLWHIESTIYRGRVKIIAFLLLLDKIYGKIEVEIKKKFKSKSGIEKFISDLQTTKINSAKRLLLYSLEYDQRYDVIEELIQKLRRDFNMPRERKIL